MLITSNSIVWLIYENVKKNPFISQETYLYIQVTDILKFMKFNFVHIVKVCFFLSLKSSHYAYIPQYMHKTLPTSGNEKEQQIKCYEKLSGEFIFSRVTNNLKMFYFTHPTGWVLKK